MRVRHLFGLETEYALTVLDRQGQPVERGRWASRMVALAHRELRCLNARSGSGVFLQNGARLYVDTGAHPELATAECCDPWEAVRQVIAGDRIVGRLAAALEAESGLKVRLHKANLDYVSGNTWGCHESYLHRIDPERLQPQIVPHLVSRVCYCGAGGLTPRTPGWKFAVSPRSFWIRSVNSGHSTHGRGIYHSRNESLSGSVYNRLHVLAGESLCSQTAIFLKVAATALVVAMVEAGVGPADAVRLSSPVLALHAFAQDPSCTATAETEAGATVSAIEIQRHFLRQAEQCVGQPFMPAWAEEACGIWRRTLDALQADPRSLERTLDWAIKRRLIERHAERRRWAAGGPPGWAEIMGLCAHHEAEFFDFQEELREIDLRFSQLWPPGIFDALDAEPGVLEHRVVSPKEIERAVRTPPAVGRARIRGDCVRRFAALGSRYACDWTSVWDLQGKRVLDLRDPFCESEQWECPEEGHTPGSRRDSILRDIQARLRPPWRA